MSVIFEFCVLRFAFCHFAFCVFKKVDRLRLLKLETFWKFILTKCKVTDDRPQTKKKVVPLMT